MFERENRAGVEPGVSSPRVQGEAEAKILRSGRRVVSHPGPAARRADTGADEGIKAPDPEESPMRHNKTPVHWEGPKTVRTLASALQQEGAAALSLAPDLHHSLFVHLYPGAGPGDPEQVDIRGDAALFGRIAEVAGLEGLAELIPALKAARAEVHVESPAPVIHILIPETGRFLSPG
jgi:hypothetical protein